MAIDRINGSGLANGPDLPAKEPMARQVSGETSGGDRVELSPRAREIASLAAANERLPEVRAERVEALRREIAEGTYRVEASIVARAFLEYEHGLED
jgi:flagellar biosynthesis anti-sigma factor FlgM